MNATQHHLFPSPGFVVQRGDPARADQEVPEQGIKKQRVGAPGEGQYNMSKEKRCVSKPDQGKEARPICPSQDHPPTHQRPNVGGSS